MSVAHLYEISVTSAIYFDELHVSKQDLNPQKIQTLLRFPPFYFLPSISKPFYICIVISLFMLSCCQSNSVLPAAGFSH